MTYENAIEYLYNSIPMFQKVGAVAYKEGLHTTEVLDEHFGHPHKNYKIIHVAGTNGKGSCSHTLAAILQSAGYRVGLYTSPHLLTFRERIRVNGKCIDERYVADFVESERSFWECLHPSFFELTTALAFKYFSDQKVDVAVVEVGLGGRLDCTNIVNPIISVITNISFDHTQFLGDTLPKIAKEKAGIMKSNVPVVIGEANEQTRPVFENRAKDLGCKLFFAEDDKEVESCEMKEYGGLAYQTKHFGIIDGELGGVYQEKNSNTVLCAIRELQRIGLEVDAESIRRGFSGVVELTGLLGRWQKVRTSPTVVCDTGHNVGGWEYLGKQLRMQKCRKMRIVFGMVSDKDVNTVMAMLPTDAIYYFTKAKTQRAINENEVLKIGHAIGLNAKSFSNVADAYNAALADSDNDDFVFVGGSSYIVADFLACLRGDNQ